MSLIFLPVVFFALSLVSILYGYDSREKLASKEEELALHGVSWDRK